jgi:hypothetical protein
MGDRQFSLERSPTKHLKRSPQKNITKSPVGVEHLRQYFMLSTHHLETQKLYPLRFHR